jgi:hypothetical protein
MPCTLLYPILFASILVLLFIIPHFAISYLAFQFASQYVAIQLLTIIITLRCSAPASHIKIVPLLEVRQLLFAGMSTYSQAGTFF